MVFPSKKDWWLTTVFWSTAIICTIAPLVKGDWIAALFLLPLSAGMIWFWFSTEYLVEGDMLIVRYGPFKHVIAISKITYIRKKRNPLSAPVLSIDRLEVNYGDYGTILISPRDQEEFIGHLLKINPKISLDLPF